MGIFFAQSQRLLIGNTMRDIPFQFIMSRCLIGEDIRYDPSLDKLRKNICSVPEEGDGKRLPFLFGVHRTIESLTKIRGFHVDIICVEPALDAFFVYLDNDGHAIIHSDGQGLCATHASEAGCEHELALERSLKMSGCHRGQCFVCSLEDSLGAYIDPASCCHLPIHSEAFCLEAAEFIPCGPLGDDLCVRNQNTWGVWVGLEDSHRFSRLHDESLVIPEVKQALHNGLITLPVSGGFSSATVDDELFRKFGHIRVQVVHHHAQGPFL